MTTTPARPRPPHHPGDDVRRFADDPLRWFGGDRDAMHRLPAPDLTALQLAALRLRFTELADRLPVVGALAREQHLDHIGTLDDAAVLLLPHTVYKSYPASLLSQGRFDQLTRWISQLTTVDLGPLAPSVAMDLALAQLGPGHEETARRLVRESAGSPFFLMELIRYLQGRSIDDIAGKGLEAMLSARIDDLVDHLERPRDTTMLRVLESKAAAGEVAIAVTSAAMRVCGGAAFSKHLAIERLFRDAHAGAVMAPTGDVLRDFIGKAILGIPLF